MPAGNDRPARCTRTFYRRQVLGFVESVRPEVANVRPRRTGVRKSGAERHAAWFAARSGKLDLASIPALALLRSRGLCRPGRFLPPWALDPGWVLSYLALNTFMVNVDLASVTEAVGCILSECPRLEVRTAEEVLEGA